VGGVSTAGSIDRKTGVSTGRHAYQQRTGAGVSGEDQGKQRGVDIPTGGLGQVPA
jgi:hypothetical protein